MDWSDRVFGFFVENFSSPAEIFGIGPFFLIWAFLWLTIAGRLKRDRGWPTGYTRKVFHFAIFLSAACAHAFGGTPRVCLFGAVSSLAIFYALMRGPGNLLYEAMAREKDEPKKTHYIIVPYLATLIGGLTGSMFFGSVAIFGYLVVGFGDAVGEPVGTRFGKHPYRVPTLTSVVAHRSVEGSIAVFVACLIALGLGVWLHGGVSWEVELLWLLPGIAVVCVLVEAVSPHGWDNFSLQLVGTVLAHVFLF